MGFEGWLEKATDTRYARVRHILVDEKGEEGRARLQEVKDEVAGDLDKFSEVAEKISTCTSAVRACYRTVHVSSVLSRFGLYTSNSVFDLIYQLLVLELIVDDPSDSSRRTRGVLHPTRD